MADEISITYEKLFDITRKEKNSEELQKLEPDFFKGLLTYLNDKSSILQKEKQGSLFSKPEKELTAKQLDNIKKLITELHMRREQKIINLAIMKSRTNSNLIDTSVLLEEEKTLFANVVSVLNSYKKSVLFRILTGEEPGVPPSISNMIDKKQQPEMEKPPVKKEKVDVEFIEDTPKFIGKELESYGPFSKDQKISLPFDVANVLINKGRAKKIE